MDYILKDWNTARIIKSVFEPSLTGVPEWRRKRYEDLMSQYAMRLSDYMFKTYESLES